MTLDLKLKPMQHYLNSLTYFSINRNNEENVAILWNGMQGLHVQD